MKDASPRIIQVLCGELCRSSVSTPTELNLLNREINGIEANITIGYKKFISNPESLHPRLLDLLQIAAYVFCADRMVYRGDRYSLNNDAWARSFNFNIPVLDIDFWNNSALKNALSESLVFMTGDRRYSFNFTKSEFGHLPKLDFEQLSLFSDEFGSFEIANETDVLLFSGGLDSLAGTIERLNVHPENKLIIVSHQSSTATKHTQNMIIKHLQQKYTNRLLPYGFLCHNRKTNSKEETQRTRMFLFSCVAFALCNYFNKRKLYVYENGVTSINLPIQPDVINARASRTTHPKTLGLMEKVFRFFDSEFCIKAPYHNKTKEDILAVFAKYKEQNLLPSSVSCSVTRKSQSSSPHCGCCSQCIDRRFAAFASSLDDFDANYTDDFITKIPDSETSQRVWQTLRLASTNVLATRNNLVRNFPDEIGYLVSYWPCDNPDDSLDEIFDLLSRYCDSIMRAAKAMQSKKDNLLCPIAKDSLLYILSSREYLKTQTQIRVDEIEKILRASIPQAFRNSKPSNETDFNNKVQALLTAANNRFNREYPEIKFGISSYRPDLSDDTIVIESKYLRGKTPPSVATEGVAADIFKLGKSPVLFIIYDPERKIIDDDVFISSFQESREFCFVRIFR